MKILYNFFSLYILHTDKFNYSKKGGSRGSVSQSCITRFRIYIYMARNNHSAPEIPTIGNSPCAIVMRTSQDFIFDHLSFNFTVKFFKKPYFTLQINEIRLTVLNSSKWCFHSSSYNKYALTVRHTVVLIGFILLWFPNTPHKRTQ